MLISRNQSRRALVLVRIVFLLHASPSSLSMDDVPPPLEMILPADVAPLSDVALPRDVPPWLDVPPPHDAAAHPIADRYGKNPAARCRDSGLAERRAVADPIMPYTGT